MTLLLDNERAGGKVDLTDPIHWDTLRQRCVSGLVRGAVVRWGFSIERLRRFPKMRNGYPVDKPECCNVLTLLGAMWFEHLAGDGEEDAGIGIDSTTASAAAAAAVTATAVPAALTSSTSVVAPVAVATAAVATAAPAGSVANVRSEAWGGGVLYSRMDTSSPQ